MGQVSTARNLCLHFVGDRLSERRSSHDLHGIESPLRLFASRDQPFATIKA
jgi:hypothetical protein